MNILDGGRDEPLAAPSARARILLGAVILALCVFAVAVVILIR
jgi:hypothetical protein